MQRAVWYQGFRAKGPLSNTHQEDLRSPGLGRTKRHSPLALKPVLECGRTFPLCHCPLPRVVDVSVPKLRISGTYDLKKTLSRLGISKIFEEHGDLARIVPHHSLKVGQVSLGGWPLPLPPTLGASHSPRLNPRSQPGSELEFYPPARPSLAITSQVIPGKP